MSICTPSRAAALTTKSLCACFFFKQKTAYELSTRDWSSDVCSSDLAGFAAGAEQPDFRDDLPRDSLMSALEQSRAYLDKLPDNRVVGTRPAKKNAAQMKSTLQRFVE